MLKKCNFVRTFSARECEINLLKTPPLFVYFLFCQCKLY
uniref:Uncharacterized protein n=1 Tax=Klebsiella quasipneumoniae TaxID=1463165 RepID=A0A6M4NSP0_9ENTR|nr:hypothetical protein [Klebsiella quasipneumoniae]